MSEARRLSNRNEQVAAMLADGEQLKNFYRFIAQNPHINLHDACQNIIERPNATVCFSFSEWAAMDRRITKGRKGIAYYDNDGYKQFVFDANDTHGDNRYSRPILPMKRLLVGLDELNDAEFADSEQSDFVKIQNGVQQYLHEQGELTCDGEQDKLLIDGISYSLYCKTGFPKSAGIKLSGLPFSYKENAEFVKGVYYRADMLVQSIEEAYSERQEDVKVIDDTEEEMVSDEPIIPDEQSEVEAEEHSAVEEPKHHMYPMYKRYKEVQNEKPQAVVMMRLGDFYEMLGDSAIIASKMLDLTLLGRDVGLLERVAMCGIPYHAMDVYVDKILKSRSVVLIENDKEPTYILSYAEALEQNAEIEEEKAEPTVAEITDSESTPLNDEQSETDEDWRKELAAELSGLDDEQADEEIEETGSDEEEELDDTDSDEQDEYEETESDEEPKDKQYIMTRLKDGSIRSACDVIGRFVLPAFGKKDIGELSVHDIISWQNNINSLKYKFKYKSKIYCGFTALMNYGIKFYNLSENVVSKVGNFKNNDRKEEMQIWTEEEFQKVYSVIDDEMYRCFFTFLYLMGTRKGEAMALTWKDMDFKNAEVKIDKSLNRKQSIKGFRQSKSKFDDVPSSMGWHSYCDRIYEITTPKNKASYRRVMMPKNLVDIISQYKIKCESEYEFNDDFFVFGGKLPLVDQTIRRRLDSYAKKAGVKQIRIHDLRHSHASLLINKGQNILIVSKRLGHSDITQTLNTYSHLFPNVQKQIIDAIDIKL